MPGAYRWGAMLHGFSVGGENTLPAIVPDMGEKGKSWFQKG